MSNFDDRIIMISLLSEKQCKFYNYIKGRGLRSVGITDSDIDDCSKEAFFKNMEEFVDGCDDTDLEFRAIAVLENSDNPELFNKEIKSPLRTELEDYLQNEFEEHGYHIETSQRYDHPLLKKITIGAKTLGNV